MVARPTFGCPTADLTAVSITRRQGRPSPGDRLHAAGRTGQPAEAGSAAHTYTATSAQHAGLRESTGQLLNSVKPTAS